MSPITWKRILRRARWALVIVACGPAFVGCPGGNSNLYTIEVDQDVVYAHGYVSTGVLDDNWVEKELLLDAYVPQGGGDARPALILVHGGSFIEGSKEKDQIVEYARFFARRGIVSFAINYRKRDDFPPASGTWAATPITAAAHAAMVDVKAAVRFVRANAEFYGVDPERIGLLGESSGAIAGVTTAVTDSEEFSQDRSDLPIPEVNYPDVSARIRAYVHFWGNADHVLIEVDRNDPPVMIVHGTDDNELAAAFGSSQRFAGVLRLWGVPYIFYEAEGFGHGAWEYREGLRNLKLLTLDFLTQYLVDPDTA